MGTKNWKHTKESRENLVQYHYENRKKTVEAGKAGTTKLVRRYLIERGIYECSECGIKEWNGRPLALQLDHINGNPHDHRLENVRWLCPNCHTQTENWGVQNVSEEGYKRMSGQ